MYNTDGSIDMTAIRFKNAKFIMDVYHDEIMIREIRTYQLVYTINLNQDINAINRKLMTYGFDPIEPPHSIHE